MPRRGDGGPREGDRGAPDASAAPDTGGIRGFSADRQEQYPVAGGAVEATERRAEAEERANEAHDPLGPGGWVEERDVTGGPATALGDRLVAHDRPGEGETPPDLLLEGPEAGPRLRIGRGSPEGEDEDWEPDLEQWDLPEHVGTGPRSVAPEPPEPPERPRTEPPIEPALHSRWLEPFARSLVTTREWMRDVALALGTTDPRAAWHALHAVLPVLRDQLTPAEVADLSAELPLLLRGLLLDGWTGQPARAPDRRALLATVERRLGRRATHEPEATIRAVARVLRERIASEEIADMLGVLPAEIRELVE